MHRPRGPRPLVSPAAVRSSGVDGRQQLLVPDHAGERDERGPTHPSRYRTEARRAAGPGGCVTEHPLVRRILFVLAVVAAVFGTVTWMDTLRTELHVAATRVPLGEPVHFTIRVCSDSYLPMRTDDGKPSWQITDEAGEVVADSSHQVFTLELKTLTWSPRQCRDALSVAWDQREWNQRAFEGDEVAGLPRRGGRVPAGRYELTATWGDLDAAQVGIHIVE